ncbi:MAG TPA: hypothetical protein VFU41_09330 [Gemmatimonadales bacterium]|nr:hypothetical protein [Gemmatimonadales bacterium]
MPRLDAAWREQVFSAWRQQYAAARQARARLQAIEARAATEPLPPELSWERIELTLNLHGDAGAEPLLRGSRALAGADLLHHAEAERRGVEDDDSFMPHGLPAEEVERMRREIAGFFDVTRACLARKVVRYLPERPYYVLGADGPLRDLGAPRGVRVTPRLSLGMALRR